ncbi:MAG: amidinotransferase [Acidothermus cellulolyticus]|jgi:N-dimethylarginine dimethylaminohydrolase|nr:amidinotransferase [Acidothermus cellulolyticus]
MTLTAVRPETLQRTPTSRRYLVCPPRYFAVQYTINPWMHPEVPTDTDRACRQWQVLVATYRRLGHQVDVIEPLPDLPDMVFAANAAVTVAGRAYGAKFRFPQRAAEAPAYQARLAELGFTVIPPTYVNEGEGDFLVVGRRFILAGHGFRTDHRAHREAENVLGLPVISLELVDPRYYHLDTAIAVLDETTIAYYPPALSRPSRAILAELFPDAIVADDADAEVFGLNAVSDGYHVVLPVQAHRLARQLAARGFQPVPVDVSEFRKAGGGPKCCTLELRA